MIEEDQHSCVCVCVCSDLLEATSPSWPSPLALWQVRPSTDGRGEHSEPGVDAREGWVPRTSRDWDRDEFWETVSAKTGARQRHAYHWF